MLWYTLHQCKSQDVKVRLAACKKLDEIRDPRQVARLLSTYDGYDVEVWLCAEVAILRMKWEAVPPLLEALQLRNPKMRAAAAVVLRSYPDAKVLAALRQALQDKDAEVRERVQAAIEKIGASLAATIDKMKARVSSTPAASLPDSVIIFREGSDQPSDPLAYVRQVVARKFNCDTSQLALNLWRVVGVRDAFDTPFAANLFALLKRNGQLPELGPVSDVFEGKGPDGRTVVAFFHRKAAVETSPKVHPALDSDHPVCSSCGKSLGEGASIFGGAQVISARPASEVQDDYTLFKGSICFQCQAVFCVECLAGRVDRCPKCQSATKPAYRRHLRELGALVT